MAANQPSRVRAEAAASRLWTRYCYSGPEDLDLTILAAARGVLVVEKPFDSADALLMRQGQHGLIRVSTRIAEPGRKRYAIAHEMGHFELHPAITQLAACTSQDMRADYKSSAAEVEANWFAAELLMPGKLFGKALGDDIPAFDAVRRLAGFFGTTLTATAVRLVELSDEECAFVVSEDGRVRWWKSSERFRERHWITCGELLTIESVAGAVFAGESPAVGPVRVDATAWGGRDGDDWWEDVAVADRYGQVLSLLRPG